MKTRGAHIMFCKLDEIMHHYFVVCITSKTDFVLLVTTHFIWFCTTIFIPCDKMSGKGDGLSASSVDLLRSDFRAMMYYDCCQGKSFQECFQSLKHCFGDQSVQSHCFQLVQMFGVRTFKDDDRCGRIAKTVTPENVSRVESLIKKDPKITYA